MLPLAGSSGSVRQFSLALFPLSSSVWLEKHKWVGGFVLIGNLILEIKGSEGAIIFCRDMDLLAYRGSGLINDQRLAPSRLTTEY